MLSENSVHYIYTDGGSRGNPGPSAYSFIIYSSSKEEIYRESGYLGLATNNFSEYTALKCAIKKAISLGLKDIEVFSDSELMVKQLNKIYQVKDINLKEIYAGVVQDLVKFRNFKITHIRREHNKLTDKLVNEKLDEYSMQS